MNSLTSAVTRRVFAAVPRRAMSSGHIDAARELATAQLWKKISFGMAGFSGLLVLYTFVLNPSHPHDLPDMPYAGIKKKHLPWGDGRTALFGNPHKGNTETGHH